MSMTEIQTIVTLEQAESSDQSAFCDGLEKVNTSKWERFFSRNMRKGAIFAYKWPFALLLFHNKCLVKFYGMKSSFSAEH